MKEERLDNELSRLYGNLLFLWKDYGFHLRYITRTYGMYHKGFILGLENHACKLVFEKETNSVREPITIYVGKRSSLFAPPNHSYYVKDGWYILPGLIHWLSGVHCERVQNVDQDLINISQYLKLHINRLLELFEFPDDFDEKLEHFKNLYKNHQITVENIKAERSRLQSLGQDSSLEAAIASLRGGKHE